MQDHKIITGDTYIDDFDVENPEHFKRVMDEARAAGEEVPKALEARYKRMKLEAEEQAALPWLVEAYGRAREAAALAKERAERARHRRFPAEPQADDDLLIVARNASALPGNGGERSAEIDGVVWEFSSTSSVHFLPREVVAKWPRHPMLPGNRFSDLPADLIRVFRNQFTTAITHSLQGITNPNFNPLQTDDEGLLRECSAVVRGCCYIPLLKLWLETAKAADDELNPVLARVIEQRLQELGANHDEPEAAA